MSSVKLPRSVPALIAGALLLTGAPALADRLVVRASGPSAGSYPPGKKLADAAPITLRNGDVLTILDGRGTRTLRGPGTFGASGAAPGVDNRLASFLRPDGMGRPRTGAVRGETAAPVEPQSNNVWDVDTRRSATVCIANPAKVNLWRVPTTAQLALSISGPGGNASATFLPAKETAVWPTTLPITDGATYQLAGSGAPITIRFVVLPADTDWSQPDATAAALIANKCDGQLDRLIRYNQQPDPAPDMPN